jgi:hypothetical protein
MPSDPSGTHPQGVLTRAAPDFFDDNIGVGGARLAFPQPSGGNYIAVSLFNGDNQGRAFKVYGIYTTGAGGEGLGFWYAKTPLGTLNSFPQAIRPDLGAPPGQIWMATSLGNPNNTPNPFTPTQLFAAIGCSGFDSATVLSPFPLFVIPAGYCLIGSNLEETFNTGCFFWYQVANE